ncbi:GlsB/YeaQ/YmgE family stress response membrane protein [soil metagenome]
MESMGLISWIVFGLLAGIVAKLLMPGKDPGGCFITMGLGIVGALLGGFIGSAFGLGGIEGFDWRSFLLAVGGAFILLLIYRLFAKKPRS